MHRKNTYTNSVDLITVQTGDELIITVYQPVFPKYSVSKHGNTKNRSVERWTGREYIHVYETLCIQIEREIYLRLQTLYMEIEMKNVFGYTNPMHVNRKETHRYIHNPVHANRKKLYRYMYTKSDSCSYEIAYMHGYEKSVYSFTIKLRHVYIYTVRYYPSKRKTIISTRTAVQMSI